MGGERDKSGTRQGLVGMAMATALGAAGCASGAPQQTEQPTANEKAPTVESTEQDAAKTTDDAVEPKKDEARADDANKGEATVGGTKDGDDGVGPDTKDDKGWNAGGARG